MGNTEPNLTPLGKTNKNHEKINKMLSLLCLLNVYETSTTVTQTTETKANTAEEEERTDENKLSRRENSPRLCLLALESLRASLWPMELRKIIASATSPSCIVLVTFLAAQGPPLRPDGAGVIVSGGTPLLDRWIPLLLGRKILLLLLWLCSLGLTLPSPPLLFSVCFTLVTAVSAGLWSGGWCCGCNSKQAQGTISHHVGGSSSKVSRQSGVVAWKGGLKGCVEDEEEERMERRSKFWWFNPLSLGWASRQAMNPLFKAGLLSVIACVQKHVSY